MKITIDTDAGTIVDDTTGDTIQLFSTQGFEAISKLWLKVGWNEKHVYTFSWMGRPIIQLPEDMIRVQEAIFQVRPTVIIETGIAHGGSLIYSASLLKMMGIDGRVIGVDIEIRPHNRKAIEEHQLFSYITLIEGSSVATDIVAQVKSLVGPDDRVLIILDSNHSRQHVGDELEAYCDLVTKGSYIVATDGIMQEVFDVPRGTPSWDKDNPVTAAHEFLERHPEFVLETPPWLFNESELTQNINTHYPDAWLKRK
ncbi:MAG: cephalosporin hydroxylase family protein [Pyrinomonadaceae bacterium]|nr:cephalosporin hydroxylase family protein [Pyrinomonadaceae bacterium]MBP6213373.1 cephalosporin hydroxylase family protein [Pyrinomonadaceae bacterium]